LASNGEVRRNDLTDPLRIAHEMIHQSPEERAVTTVRSQMTLTFPSDFTLLAAMNPCP
jgi:magnesium chelatase family protein